MLTPEQREEGRRLLAKFNTSVADNPQGSAAISAVRPLRDWLLDHADALLADHEEIDSYKKSISEIDDCADTSRALIVSMSWNELATALDRIRRISSAALG